MDPERRKELARRLQASRGVVVACHDDDVELGQALAGPRQERVPEPLCLGRRVGRIEDIAGNEQGVDFLVGEDSAKPVEETQLLVIPRQIVEGVTEVPVGRMEDAHLRKRIIAASGGGAMPKAQPAKLTIALREGVRP